jgi:pre-mRNA-splicing helicase BRR2
LEKLSHHLPTKLEAGAAFHDPHTKTNILLQAHFSRISLSAVVADDVAQVLPDASRLLQAMVDVISSSGWLSPALACMELSQMVTQGCWNTDPPLLQLPHFTREICQQCQQRKIETISDLSEMEDKDRNSLLQLSSGKLQAIASFCNRYPDIEVKHQLVSPNQKIIQNDRLQIVVNLLRDPDDEDAEELRGVPVVAAPRYPVPKTEGWWLVLGNPSTNELVAIKRVAFKRRALVERLEFVAPQSGNYKYMLYLMSDSYMGVDQEFSVEMKVAEGKPQQQDQESKEEAMTDDKKKTKK